MLLLAAILAGPGCSRDAPAPARTPPADVLLLDLDGRVGVEISDATLAAALAADGGEPPDVLVLRIDSPGGHLAAVPAISDRLHGLGRQGVRLVAWVNTALSAAALVAVHAPEIVLAPDGRIGGAVASDRDAAAALRDEALQRVLFVGEASARRGGHDPLLVRAMQTPTPLTGDVAADGSVRLRTDGAGAIRVTGPGEILTITAGNAERLGLAIGTARDRVALAERLGLDRPEWRGAAAQDALDAVAVVRARVYDALDAARVRLDRALARHDEAADAARRAAALDVAADLLAEIERLAAEAPGLAEEVGYDAAWRAARRAAIDDRRRGPG